MNFFKPFFESIRSSHLASTGQHWKIRLKRIKGSQNWEKTKKVNQPPNLKLLCCDSLWVMFRKVLFNSKVIKRNMFYNAFKDNISSRTDNISRMQKKNTISFFKAGFNIIILHSCLMHLIFKCQVCFRFTNTNLFKHNL